MSVKSQLLVSVEGMDEEGRVQLGDPASLVVEGSVGGKYVPEDCTILVRVSSSVGGTKDGVNEVDFSLNVEDFLSASGPFLCQIDFEAENVGEMGFVVALKHGRTTLAKDTVTVRVVNALRDSSGKRRKQGPGALKVKK